MKLLILSHYFDAHRGGVEIVAGRLAEELSWDFDVLWLATGETQATRAKPRTRRQSLAATNAIERAAALPYPLLSFSAISMIFGAARESDAILAHDAIYMTSVAGFLASRIYRKPFVVVQHIGLVPYRNPLFAALMRAANRLVVRPILQRADQVVFISETTRRHFASVDFKRAPCVIFNGVDASIFHPPTDEAEIAAARMSLKLPADAPIVLFVGRFVEKKGLAILERLARAAGNSLRLRRLGLARSSALGPRQHARLLLARGRFARAALSRGRPAVAAKRRRRLSARRPRGAGLRSAGPVRSRDGVGGPGVQALRRRCGDRPRSRPGRQNLRRGADTNAR
jgi:glycosyltransferase involved in cell wall biosynthesis